MASITCQNCGITCQRREGTLFCSPKCKSEYWNSKGKSKDDYSNKSLRNIVSDEKPLVVIPSKYISTTEMQPNPNYQAFTDSCKRLEDDIKRLLEQNKRLLAELNGMGGSVSFGSSILGGFVGLSQGGLMGVGVGLFAGMLVGNAMDKSNLKTLDNRLEAKKEEILITNQLVEERKRELSILRGKNHLIFSFDFVQVQILNPEWIDYEKEQTIKKEEKISKKEEVPIIPSAKSEKIISSRSLEQMVFNALNFQGKWKEFIGQPSIDFFMIVHGRAGSGKSTFSIQFAYYLAENYGDVIYISAEEGFNKTFKDKMVSNDAVSENLYFADLHSLDEILENVPMDRFHFVIVDSLVNLGIEASGVKRLRENFKGAAIIAITQSTKDGKMRGSNEIVHDSDIEVYVDNGTAITFKNRFYRTGEEFEIFEKLDRMPIRSKGMKPPRNIV